jgi:preprotein translocase subunit SecE
MARDRKRAKQRRARQRAAVPPSQPRRVNVPGQLDHASGEVDEFEAALVAGADGEEATGEEIAAAADAADLTEPDLAEELDDGDLDAEDLEGEDRAVATRGAGAVARRASAPPAERREGNPVVNFLRASWAELQRVQWPDRRQVAQATAVVLGFVALAGAYLGVADYVFGKLVDAII